MIQIELIVVTSLETITLTNWHLKHADVPKQVETLPETVTVVVTADRLVPKAPWNLKAVPGRRDPQALTALPAPLALPEPLALPALQVIRIPPVVVVWSK